MTQCNRLGSFGKEEKHKCFVCEEYFYPSKNETCSICNWKRCNNGHCGCNVSKETRERLDQFYDLFCEPHNFSKETKKALLIMVETFYNHCLECLGEKQIERIYKM